MNYWSPYSRLYAHTKFDLRILAYQLPSLLQTYLPRPPLTQFVYFLEDPHEIEINANSKESSVQPNLQVIILRCHLCYTCRTRNNMNVICRHNFFYSKFNSSYNFIFVVPCNLILGWRNLTRCKEYAAIYFLLNYSTRFGWPSRPSSGVYNTAVAASGTDHTVRGASFFKRDKISPYLVTF